MFVINWRTVQLVRYILYNYANYMWNMHLLVHIKWKKKYENKYHPPTPNKEKKKQQKKRKKKKNNKQQKTKTTLTKQKPTILLYYYVRTAKALLPFYTILQL